MKKASVNSVKLIRAIVPDTVRASQRRSPALTRVRGRATAWLEANNTKPAGKWIERFEEWLADSGFLKKQ